MNKVEWKRLEGKNQKSKFQVTFQLQLENHHFESELKSDLKFIIFAISLQLLRFKLETMCGVLNLWIGREKSKVKISSHFSAST